MTTELLTSEIEHLLTEGSNVEKGTHKNFGGMIYTVSIEKSK